MGMILIERLLRKCYRLIHFVLFGISFLFVFMHTVFHVYWTLLSAKGYSNKDIGTLDLEA
jgi:hypothetical protein